MSNESNERTFVYDVASTFTVAGSPKLVFIQDWEFAPSMAEFDIDRIDSAAPIFTKKSDILGTFSFRIKNTTDMYATTFTGGSDQQITKWVNGISLGNPSAIAFVIKVKAADPAATGVEIVTYSYTGRVMDVSVTRTDETGVHDAIITGEITAITETSRKV